ncbi:hypothetical protein SCP_0607590 [Sparassis crispa]|uniref:Uncharacterized protein n=1 Tax=Sparassis crispa TaxID=139825 RepID=A0A401GRI6_9APHY|nr:hypothetical protein SCP_0607590 [Sparassis crispa]GBE84779.1 hypothetical protein SCP_0607590 [Sparassis crispa]
MSRSPRRTLRTHVFSSARQADVVVALANGVGVGAENVFEDSIRSSRKTLGKTRRASPVDGGNVAERNLPGDGLEDRDADELSDDEILEVPRVAHNPLAADFVEEEYYEGSRYATDRAASYSTEATRTQSNYGMALRSHDTV